MGAFLSVVTLITQALMKLPLIDKIIRDIVNAIGNVIKEHDQKKFEKELKEAAVKAETTKDTSDLESLMGKP